MRKRRKRKKADQVWKEKIREKNKLSSNYGLKKKRKKRKKRFSSPK